MEYRDFVPRREAIVAVLFMGITSFLCGLLCGYGLGSRKGGNIETHTVVDTIRDTVPSVMPVAVDSVQKGIIRVPVILPSEPTVPKATIKVHNSNSLFSDNTASGLQERGNFASKDTAWITIQRTQKRYEDSLYSAWVSGYEARLDSIHVYRRTVTRTVVVHDTALKGGARNWLHEHFGAGIVGGAGYGLTTKRPDVFVGVGGWIRIF